MTGYHQVPRQSSFFQINSELDPWIIKASNDEPQVPTHGADWKVPLSPPSLFDEQQDWSPPDSPPSSPPNIAAIKKSLIKAQQFISTASHVDPWTINHTTQQKEELEELNAASVNLYKTELCRSFMETNTCRYGVKCQFAHGRHEVRPVARHPKYKTEICKTFHTLGTCPYGIRCRFIHTRPSDGSPDSSRSSDSSSSSSPSLSPPSSPTSSTTPPVLRWSHSWSSIERPLPPSPPMMDDFIVPEATEHLMKTRLPIFRNIC